MLDCLVLGDSIASGVGQARPECLTVARVGITSGAYINELFPGAQRVARTAVISLGVNDDPSMDTIDNLRRVRGALQVAGAVWLLPGLKDDVRAAIRTVAAEYGDQLIDTRPLAGPDHLHPTGTGYRVIAGRTLQPGETEVAFDPVPLPRPTREMLARREDRLPDPGSGAGHTRYRVVFRGKLQQMADLRLQLAHQQAGYTKWPAAHITYAALPPPSFAYRAFRATVPAGSTSFTAEPEAGDR